MSKNSLKERERDWFRFYCGKQAALGCGVLCIRTAFVPCGARGRSIGLSHELFRWGAEEEGGQVELESPQ